ncbi:hypothetical protein [Billgrantia aerodenitrificans]|uniref:hypothetical protein n=1 Tax=Billgrantia aerodenitrificans TaxID=2733483 RepID=UPI001F1BA174|nr:hypothetical protein [Halomonas aerodenitrificans]
MIEVHVINVPEFRPMVDTMRGKPDVTITGPVKGYWTISAPNELTFERKAMQMKPAVWYGIFTGGLNGEITHWGRDEVRITGTSRPL